MIDRNLTVERKTDGVVVRSQYNAFAVGVGWTIALIAAIITNVGAGVLALDNPLDVVGTIFLLLVGLFLMLHRTIETSFYPVKQQVVQQRLIWFLWRWRRRSYSFSAIAGVGIKRYWNADSGQSSYSPVMTLKDGSEVQLLHESESQSNCAEAVTTIRTATGLARLDLTWPDDAPATSPANPG